MGTRPPSTYTPFLRRFFSNERSKELEEVERLHASVSDWQRAFQETKSSIAARFEPYFDSVTSEVRTRLDAALCELISAETQIWELPAPDFARMNMREFVEYRNLLVRKQYFFANQDELLQLLHEGLLCTLGAFAQDLPRMSAPSPFTLPAVFALPDPYASIEQVFGTLIDPDYEKRGLFDAVTTQLYRNICTVSGVDPNDPHPRRSMKTPRESGLPLGEAVDAYLGRTPFHRVFTAPVALKLTHEDRFNHWHVLAGSGQGKTVLIENVIRHDVASENSPSIVLIDPHSDLVRKLVRSDLGIEDRVILIDPRDTQHPVALNPFAVNRARFANYDEATKEQVTAGVIQTFGYLWSGLTSLTLTGKQDVFFRYVTRLMLTLPDVEGRNATILDMLKLMQDPTPYARAIEALPDIPREFFLTDFKSKSFEGTKEQVRYRLQAIIESPTMARLFTAPETKVDFFTEMNRGAVILVDTAKDFLKEGSAVFGKLIISLILQAVLERAAIPEGKRKPTFLMVDEAGSFFSNNIDDLLTEARKYKCGLLLAHQYLDQASSSLRSSLAANAGIKFASGLSAQDAAAMAREMRTNADFILEQPKLQFAAYVRNVTGSAVAIPLRPASHPPQLSDAAFERLIARNRAQVAATPEHSPKARYENAEPDEDISPEW